MYNCITCDFHKFTLRGLERISSDVWQALLECNECWTNQSVMLHGKLEQDVERALRKLLRPKRTGWHLQEAFAFEWDTDIGGYDLTRPRPIKKFNNDF